MKVQDLIQLKTLHETHTGTQSCDGCILNLDEMIEKARKIAEAKELLRAEL